METLSTCKIIFAVGITKEQVEKILAKHTTEFTINNFYAEKEIGSNKIAFAVVDIPQNIMPALLHENLVVDIDLMASYSAKFSNKCSEGGT